MFVITKILFGSIVLQVFLLNTNSVPLKSKNYHKFFLNGIKPVDFLLVSAKHYEPFVYQNEKGKFDNGIEYKLLTTIAKKENLDMVFVEQFDDKHNIYDRDILAGGHFPNLTSLDQFTMSKSYYQDDLTWCVRKSKYFPLILNIYFGTTLSIWIGAISTGFFIGTMAYLYMQFDLEYKKRNQHDLYYALMFITIPGVIGMNARYNPKLFFMRLFYIGALILMVFFWQIVFFLNIRYIKIPIQRHQISTTAEIIDLEHRLTGSTEVRGLISFDDRYKKSQIDSFFVCPSIDWCLDHLKHDDNDYLAVGGSRQHILNSRSYSPSRIFCFDRDENIANYQPALLMRKDFDLRRRIDEIIRNAFEGGLFVKWDQGSQRKKERIVPFEENPQLTFQEYAFFLIICGCGWVLAFSVFLIELFIQRKINQNPKSHFWTFSQRFVDGKRYYFKNVPEKLMATNQHRNENGSILLDKFVTCKRLKTRRIHLQ